MQAVTNFWYPVAIDSISESWPDLLLFYFQNRLNITKTIRKFSIGPDLQPTGSEFHSLPSSHLIKHGEEDEESVEGAVTLTTSNFDKYSHQ